jgi:nucleotide-binding universal stress UspA family protein
VDFSDLSRRALDHAIAVSRWYGSRLSVLYVHHAPTPRKATCPLLTIPRGAPDANGAVPRLFHRIVAAVDFSHVSMHALEYAASLAQEADAHLTVVHVIHVPEHIALWFERGDAVSPIREMRAAAERRLSSAVADEVRLHCHVSDRVEVGDPYREILRVTDEQHAGLVVIAARTARASSSACSSDRRHSTSCVTPPARF